MTKKVAWSYLFYAAVLSNVETFLIKNSTQYISIILLDQEYSVIKMDFYNVITINQDHIHLFIV